MDIIALQSILFLKDNAQKMQLNNRKIRKKENCPVKLMTFSSQSIYTYSILYSNFSKFIYLLHLKNKLKKGDINLSFIFIPFILSQSTSKEKKKERKYEPAPYIFLSPRPPIINFSQDRDVKIRKIQTTSALEHKKSRESY